MTETKLSVINFLKKYICYKRNECVIKYAFSVFNYVSLIT